MLPLEVEKWFLFRSVHCTVLCVFRCLNVLLAFNRSIPFRSRETIGDEDSFDDESRVLDYDVRRSLENSFSGLWRRRWQERKQERKQYRLDFFGLLVLSCSSCICVCHRLFCLLVLLVESPLPSFFDVLFLLLYSRVIFFAEFVGRSIILSLFLSFCSLLFSSTMSSTSVVSCISSVHLEFGWRRRWGRIRWVRLSITLGASVSSRRRRCWSICRNQAFFHPLFLLHPSILEPDLYLSFVQLQSLGDLDPSCSSQILVKVELLLEFCQLLRCKVGPSRVVCRVACIGETTATELCLDSHRRYCHSIHETWTASRRTVEAKLFSRRFVRCWINNNETIFEKNKKEKRSSAQRRTWEETWQMQDRVQHHHRKRQRFYV